MTMLKNLTYPLTLVASLLFVSISMPVLAADNTEALINDKNKTMQSSMQQSEKININKATNEELAMIKGLGTKKAQAIIDYRQANGDFMNIESLIKVKGIGKGTLEKMKPYIAL